MRYCYGCRGNQEKSLVRTERNLCIIGYQLILSQMRLRSNQMTSCAAVVAVAQASSQREDAFKPPTDLLLGQRSQDSRVRYTNRPAESEREMSAITFCTWTHAPRCHPTQQYSTCWLNPSRGGVAVGLSNKNKLQGLEDWNVPWLVMLLSSLNFDDCKKTVF